VSKALTAKERQRIASQNRVRSTMFLPSDVDLNEVDWIPTKEEKQARLAEQHWQASLRRLARLKQRWDEQDAAQKRRRLRELEAAIAADKKWIAEFEEKERRRMVVEAETKRVHDWWVAEQTNELLARAKRASKEIYRDAARAEREELIRRGAYKGRSRPTSRYYDQDVR
jgi:hypothetical protein